MHLLATLKGNRIGWLHQNAAPALPAIYDNVDVQQMALSMIWLQLSVTRQSMRARSMHCAAMLSHLLQAAPQVLQLLLTPCLTICCNHPNGTNTQQLDAADSALLLLLLLRYMADSLGWLAHAVLQR